MAPLPTLRPRPPRSTLAALACTFLMLGSLHAAVASDTPVVEFRKTDVVFEGWGTSLVWFANAVGRWPDAERTALADELFTEKGLGLTVVRYNIGGGEAPGHQHMAWFRQMEGFLSADGRWDWEADRGQRWMLKAALSRGAKHLEAFSNSPPYWMTVSGCASGNSDGNRDNLAPAHEKAFAAYLAEVVAHFQASEGIAFETLDPFNEPYTDYWKANGGQEGCHFDHATQSRLLRLTREALDQRDLRNVKISASDETNYLKARQTLEKLEPSALAVVDVVNAHAYDTQGRIEFRDTAARLGKPVIMSEVDGGGGIAHDHASMKPALELAARIVDDLRDLRPKRWIFWQVVEDETGMTRENTNWGLIHADLLGGTHAWVRTKKYHVMAQFSRYLRPGQRLLECSDGQAVAMLDEKANRLVVVMRNGEKVARTLSLRTTPLIADPSRAIIFRTSANEDVSVETELRVLKGEVTVTLPPESVTTIVIH